MLTIEQKATTQSTGLFIGVTQASVIIFPLLQKLEDLNQFPDFNNYLIFVLTKLKNEGELFPFLLV